MSLLNNSRNHRTTQRTMDYDIHGIVGVRLINPLDSDIAAVADLLEQYRAPLRREPDLVIRFKDDLPTPGLKHIGEGYAGFTEEGFYVLSKGRASVKACIPFEQIGSRCEILHESGPRSVPLLTDIINYTFLSKGYIPLHASAFVHNETGILVAGWMHGGKTEALLAFANHGAHYVGDEWVMLSPDGESMFGMPESLCIWDWYVKYIPKLLPRISMERKILFKIIYIFDAIHKIFGRGIFEKFFPIKMLGEALPVFKQQLKVRVVPKALFKDRMRSQATPQKLFLIMGENNSGIHIETCDPMEIADRMVGSNNYEQMYFWEFYEAFKFAFPHRRNDFLDNIDDRQRSLLMRALKNKEAYKISHPYPVSFDELFNKMQPLCNGAATKPVNQLSIREHR
ncbi:hypothetical protein GWO43_00575 [candidate division KSB1 bacterium]|nr:hypothetical protein [candidate division KSB1 bacterium]NIT69418.1 hypothetical protein [candidate division KSB1 bacterium]NIX69099.1 hypothetical protein [candidate division KSB1 bacterium]